MSSVMRPRHEQTPLPLLRMRVTDVDEVARVEHDAYPFPWTRGNFLDSLDSAYSAWVLREQDGRLAGYFLLMPVVDEMHLLNITVRPDLQGRGLGSRLLGKACELTRANAMSSILLEVRPSNQHAVAVYQHLGFEQVGLRKYYYPAAAGQREDAIVMRLKLSGEGQ